MVPPIVSKLRELLEGRRRPVLYALSALFVIVSFVLWYDFRAPPINSNIGFDLYPLRQVGLSTSPFNPYLWPGSYVPWTLGFPVELYYGTFYTVSGGSYAAGLFASVVLLDTLGALCLCYLAMRWLARFGVREEYALVATLIYAFNDYRLLNGFGTTDGYLSAGILPSGDPAILLILSFLTYLALFRGRRYLFLLGAFSFFAFSNFPTASLTLLQEYALVLVVLLAYRWQAWPRLDARARLRRIGAETGILAGALLVANAYLLYPLSLVLASYLTSLGAANPAYTFSFGFDTSQNIPNAVRMITNWAVFSSKSPPWATTYLNAPVAIALSFVVPFFAFAATLFLRRLSDVVLYAMMVVAAVLSASITTPFGPGFVWLTTNIAPFRAFYYGAAFSPILLVFYCFFAPVSIALLPRWIRSPPAVAAASATTAGPTVSPEPIAAARRRPLGRLRPYVWPTLVVALLLAASYPALTPAFSQEHAAGYPIDSSLPSYYGAAATYLTSSDPNGPTMVFPLVQQFDSNAVNGTTWYSGIDLYPNLIPNPSISSAYPSNYHGEDGANLPVPGFIYDMGGSVCATPACSEGGVNPVPDPAALSEHASVDYATANSSVIGWQAGFATDNVSFAPSAGGTSVEFRINSSVVEPTGHWMLGFLPGFENLSAYEFALVNYSLSGVAASSIYFGFHSHLPYGPGNAYALGNYSVVARGPSTTVLIPLANPSIRVNGTLDNVTNLFFVDQSPTPNGTVALTVHSLRLLPGNPFIAPVWSAGTREDRVTLSEGPAGAALGFAINRSVYESNGHWALGYYDEPTNLSGFDFAVLNYSLDGIDPSYLDFGFHSGVNYGPGSGFALTSYLTYRSGDRYLTIVPLAAPTLSTGARLANVTNLFFTYTPPTTEPGTGYLNVSSLRLAIADPEGGLALAGALARLGVEFAYVDTSVVVTNYVGYLGNYYNDAFGSSPWFDRVFHAGTVTIYRDLLYDGPIGSPSGVAPLIPTNATLGPLDFALTNVFYNSSNTGLAYLPSGAASTLSAYTPAVVSSVQEVSATEYTLHVEAKNASVLELRTEFSNDWEAIGSNGTVLPSHFEIDGFANGWLLPRGNYDLTLRIPWAPVYAGVEAATFAIPPLFVALFLVLVYRGRRRGRRPTETRVGPGPTSEPKVAPGP